MPSGCARDGLRQRHRRPVDYLSSSVARHPLGLGRRGDGVHVRAGPGGELGQKRADSAGRTDDQHDLAVQRRQRLRNLHRGDAHRGQRGGSDRVQAGRYPRQRGVLAAGHVLRVGPGRSQRRDQQLPEDLIPRREPGRARPILPHRAGQVGTEHHRERARHPVLPPSVRDLHIHRVHPGGLDRDEHLSRPGRRSRQLRDRRAGTVTTDCDRTHGSLLAGTWALGPGPAWLPHPGTAPRLARRPWRECRPSRRLAAADARVPGVSITFESMAPSPASVRLWCSRSSRHPCRRAITPGVIRGRKNRLMHDPVHRLLNPASSTECGDLRASNGGHQMP